MCGDEKEERWGLGMRVRCCSLRGSARIGGLALRRQTSVVAVAGPGRLWLSDYGSGSLCTVRACWLAGGGDGADGDLGEQDWLADCEDCLGTGSLGRASARGTYVGRVRCGG